MRWAAPRTGSPAPLTLPPPPGQRGERIKGASSESRYGGKPSRRRSLHFARTALRRPGGEGLLYWASARVTPMRERGDERAASDNCSGPAGRRGDRGCYCAHARDSGAGNLGTCRRRGLFEARDAASHRFAQGTRRARQAADLGPECAPCGCGCDVGRQPCPGGRLPRPAARHPGDDRDARGHAVHQDRSHRGVRRQGRAQGRQPRCRPQGGRRARPR